ncbi:hypothetical protein PGC35_21675 [Psychrobacillus sp. PGGUH221]|uniref:hypothetical protein n=1 Tax=Psychrobacillus sp. PGGUH221 TaxID=3020058 RepID=UPI0035C6E50D
MAIRIAMIGSEETLQQALTIAKDIEDIEISPIMYRSPNESNSLLNLTGQCDVILFSGELSFHYAQKELARFNQPTLYIPDDELSVALTLLYISNHLKIDYNQLSIDLTDRKYLHEVLGQFDDDITIPFIQDYPWLKEATDRTFQIESVIARHVELWESKQVSYVITSIHAVYDRLIKLDIPCIRLMEPKKNIIETLIKARNLGELSIAKKSQIAVGTFVFYSDEPIAALEIELVNIAKLTNCTVKKISPQDFIIYGTRSGVEYLLENRVVFENLFRTLNNTASTVNVGFGYGMTIVEAEKNANIALSYSQKNKKKNIFHVVNDEQTVINPFQNQDRSSILKSENMNLIKIAKELGISVTNLNKMIQFHQTRPINRFTSSDISEYFGIGKRAAEQILKKFSAKGYIKVIGEEQPHLNGRPRSVYRLELPHI